MSIDLAFQLALNEMYAGYMAKRDLVAGLLDREFKDPEVILAIARKLDLLPDPRRVVKITGSKGKGTTSRLIAFYLQHFAGHKDIALFVSPEEFQHTDRMKINGAPIGRETFVSIFELLKPHLRVAERRLEGNAYLSPFGIFLLVALTWFRQHHADWYVLEIGRGGAHDEVGVMPAGLALITSIFNEHPDHLGPSLRDIAAEKTAIAAQTQRTITSTQTKTTLMQCGIWEHYPFVAESVAPLRKEVPLWLAVDDRLARQAVTHLIGESDAALMSCCIDDVSAAWGSAIYGGVQIVYDAMINLGSLDLAWFERTFATEKTLILFSLPDDKDRDRIAAFMQALPNASAREVVLLGKRGYLSYEEAEKNPGDVCGRLHYEDDAGFRALLAHEIGRSAPTKVYCFGTHTYVRLVKSALAGGPLR